MREFLIRNTVPLSGGKGGSCVCACVLTKALVFLSIWFYCNNQQEAPSVTAMGSAMQEVTDNGYGHHTV